MGETYLNQPAKLHIACNARATKFGPTTPFSLELNIKRETK